MAAPTKKNDFTNLASASNSDLDVDIDLNLVEDEELDFFSSNFNPERALFADNIEVPHPEIKSFPTVTNYREAVERRRLLKKKAESESPKTLESQTVEAKKLNPPKTAKSNSADIHHRKILTDLPAVVKDLELQKDVKKQVC